MKLVKNIKVLGQRKGKRGEEVEVEGESLSNRAESSRVGQGLIWTADDRRSMHSIR